VVLRPVGDQPPGVYWIRRGLVLAGLVVLVALVWWIWPSGGDETAPTSANPTPTPTASVTPSDTASSSPKASKTKASKEELLPPCADSAIEVTVVTDAETYPADRQPSFTLAVENVSGEACSRDVGQAANELRVTSGGTQVWSSDDCNPGGGADETNLDPRDRFVQTVSWPKVQSAEGCPTPQESAAVGTYQVVARNLDLLSEPAVFVLE
jgi:hypothetical protein